MFAGAVGCLLSAYTPQTLSSPASAVSIMLYFSSLLFQIRCLHCLLDEIRSCAAFRVVLTVSDINIERDCAKSRRRAIISLSFHKHVNLI